MKVRSLRLRLLLGAAAAVFVALSVSGIALTLLFERHIERRVEAELTNDARRLVAGLTVDTQGQPHASTLPADSRFAQPASGLYWQLSTPTATLKSHSLWDQSLPPFTRTPSDEWQTRTAAGPFDQELFLVQRVVRPEREGAPVLVQLAQDRALIGATRNEFARELALYLLVLWAVLAAAGWLQVELGLRPLGRLRKELAELNANPSARLASDHPPEVEPLTQAINALADAREKDLAAARRRAADLAHGLKTPLAALSAQSRRARAAGATEAADGLDRAIAAAGAAIEAELARARVARLRTSPKRAQTPALGAVERVVSVVERTDFGANRVFDVDVPPHVLLPLDADAATELLGPLIENAARHARRRVKITAGHVDPTGEEIAVEDDGPGLGGARPEDVLGRGARLDETASGHGLGLAIARDIAEASGGALRINSSGLGGLRVSVSWPAGPRAAESARQPAQAAE